MLAHRPAVVVVVGAGLAPGDRVGPGDGGDLRGYGVDLEIAFAGRVRPGGRRVPLAHAVGAWLLDEAGFAGTRLGVGPADLAALVRDLPGPLGVLAMGDGSARRTAKAPGYLDDAAAPFDAAVAAALASGDAARAGRPGSRRGGTPARRGCADLAGRRRGAGRPRRHRAPAPGRRAVRGRLPRRRLDRRVTALPPVVAVVGPTATGKTALAVELARRLGGEVVNADSMQLYRGMDIGTAKPDATERGGVPHHLLDLWHVRAGRVRRRVPGPRARRDRPAPGGRDASPCWSAGRACTSAPSSTTWSSPAPTRPSGRGWRRSWPTSVRPGCTTGWPRWTRPPRPRCCPATDGGSCARWRSSS